jgi:AraC family transcriptional activator of mtrCDE
LLALMREEADAPGEGGAALLRHLSGALFAVALRAAMGQQPSAVAEAPGVLALGAHPRLAALVVDILGNLAQDWTLDRMAGRAALSRSSLIRTFQAAAGVSPAEFLNQVRMTEAARRLRAGRESPAAIGEAVGYASDAAFQRAFKREIGVTPAAWRDGIEAGPEFVGVGGLPVRKRLGG